MRRLDTRKTRRCKAEMRVVKHMQCLFIVYTLYTVVVICRIKLPEGFAARYIAAFMCKANVRCFGELAAFRRRADNTPRERGVFVDSVGSDSRPQGGNVNITCNAECRGAAAQKRKKTEQPEQQRKSAEYYYNYPNRRTAAGTARSDEIHIRRGMVVFVNVCRTERGECIYHRGISPCV
jgi:hypothetical protein